MPPFIRELARLRGYRSTLHTPLMSDGAAIGMVIVTRKEPGAFAAADVKLLRTFADQAVIAIENVRLFDEVQADARPRGIASAADGDRRRAQGHQSLGVRSAAVLRTLVEFGRETVRRRQGDDDPRDQRRLLPCRMYGFSEEFMSSSRNIPVVPERGSITGWAMLEGKAIQVEDVEAAPEYWPKNFAKRSELRTGLGIPMMRNGAPIGVLALMRTDVRLFNAKQIELVQTFADQAVIAIENARLFDEVQAKTRDLEESLQQQTATADVLKVISRSAFDLDAVFDALLTSAVSLVGSRGGTICVREGDRLREGSSIAATKSAVSWPTPGIVISRRQAAEALVMRLMSASIAATALITAVRAALKPRMAAERPAIPSLALRAWWMKAAVSARGSRIPNTTARPRI